MAAKRAKDVYDYGEAVRLLERALKVQEIFAPDDKTKRCELLISLCEALYGVPDFVRVRKEAEIAFSLAESIGDNSHAVRACRYAIYSIAAEEVNLVTPEAGEWVKRIDRYARPGTTERIYADVYLGSRKIVSGERKAGLLLLEQAVDMARSAGDRQALWRAASILLFYLNLPENIEKKKQLSEELWAGPHDFLNDETAGVTLLLLFLSSAFLTMGNKPKLMEIGDKLRALAERTGNIKNMFYSTGVDEYITFMDGRFEDTLNLIEKLRVLKEESRIFVSTAAVATYNFWIKLYLEEPLESYTPEDMAIIKGQIGMYCLLQAQLGHKDEVSEILENNVVNRPGIGTLEDVTLTWEDCCFLLAAVLVNHKKTAELLLQRLNVPGLNINFPRCILRILGSAAALLERYDEAREYYKKAIKVCTDMRFRPELALSRLGLAELLLDHFPNEKTEALEHLDFSIKEFRDMKMQVSLERALRRKDILKA